jgi:PQQ-like domain
MSEGPFGTGGWQNGGSQNNSVLPTNPTAGRRSLSTAAMAAVIAGLLVVVGGGGYLAWQHAKSSTSGAKAAAPVTPPAAASPASSSALPSAQPTQPSARPTATETKTDALGAAVPGTAKASAAGWDLTGLHPVTAPVLVGGRLVLYTADGGQLTLRALDPASGSTVWARPATLSASTPGQTFDIPVAGTTAFYYAAAGDPAAGGAVITAVNATTGQTEWATQQPLPYEGMPALCSDHAALCTPVLGSDATHSALVRTSVTTGAQAVISTDSGRSLGVGVWAPDVRDPEYVEHISDTTGALGWRDAVLALAGAPVSSDDGWNFDSYGDTYVGWLGVIPTNPSDDGGTIDLAAQRTFAIRASDGVRLWERPGLYGCPIQGITDAGQPVAVRCVGTGRLTYTADGDTPTITGLDVTIQGFNVHTGATLWSDHLGNAPAAVGAGTKNLVRMSGDVFAFTAATGRTTLLNLKTGAATTPRAGVNGWCLQQGTYNLTDETDQDGKPLGLPTGALIAPCTAAGAVAAPSDGSFTGAGATAAGYFIWASTDGVHAFKLH